MNKNDKIVKAPNLNFLTKAHENKWVAISSDYKRLVASGDTLRSLMNKTQGKKVVITRVLPREFGYAPEAYL